MASSFIPDNLEPITSDILGQTIKVGDKVITFTKGYSGVSITKGTYMGTCTRVEKWGRSWTYYLVDREDGKRAKLQYCRIVQEGTTLAELDGLCVG